MTNVYCQPLKTLFLKRSAVAFLSSSVATAALVGCSSGKIEGVSTTPGSMAAASLGSSRSFQLSGTGVCGKVQIDFGDGTPPAEMSNYDFANPQVATHTYTGWGGKKTVKAGSLSECVGMPEMAFTVFPLAIKIAYVATATANCGQVPNKPPLRKNTKVHITAITVNAAGNPVLPTRINFGCPLDGCVHDKDGIPGQADANHPFPGFRPFSLVVKVGTTYYQGGKDVTFMTLAAGHLEVCRNEGQLANHTLGWGMNIEVDESQAQ